MRRGRRLLRPSSRPSLAWLMMIAALSAWVEGVVNVLHATLVVNEGGGANDLADIVVVGGYTGEEGVGADHFGGALGEIADDQGVVVCAGGLAHEAAKNGLVGVCQLHELHGGGDTKNSAQE